METLALTYGDEMEQISSLRVAIVDPGATATAMRSGAFPGEDAATIQQPAEAGRKIAQLVIDDFEAGCRLRLTS